MVILFDNNNNNRRREEMNSGRYGESGRHWREEMAMMEHQGVGKRTDCKVDWRDEKKKRMEGKEGMEGWMDGVNLLGLMRLLVFLHLSEKRRARPAASRRHFLTSTSHPPPGESLLTPTTPTAAHAASATHTPNSPPYSDHSSAHPASPYSCL